MATREEIEHMIEVMQSYADGKEIEAQNKVKEGNWVTCSTPVWDWNHYTYRIAEPKPIPATMDWSQTNLNYFAMDSDGVWWGYRNKPSVSDWAWCGEYTSSINHFATFKPGNMPWDQSLICRPGFE